MCVLRVFALMMFTMVMLFRIDWDVYMRGLEGWDTGTHVFTCTCKVRGGWSYVCAISSGRQLCRQDMV